MFLFLATKAGSTELGSLFFATEIVDHDLSALHEIDADLKNGEEEEGEEEKEKKFSSTNCQTDTIKADASIKAEDNESETKYSSPFNGKGNAAPVKIEFKKKPEVKIPVEMKHKSTMKKPKLTNKGKFSLIAIKLLA